MESVWHITKRESFQVSDEDFEKFQNIFARQDTHQPDYAIVDVEFEIESGGISFERTYDEDEIKSIFQAHAEYTGLDKLIAKDNVADLSDRRKAEREIKTFIEDGTQISTDSAKVILKVLEAFESYECQIDSDYQDNDEDF